MNIRKVLQSIAALFLGMSTLLTVSLSTVHAAPGSDACSWNGSADTTFSNAANWDNCSGAAPVTGDTVTFDNTTIPSSGDTLTDDLGSGVNLAGINFTGTGTDLYTITASPTVYLSGNITDTTTESGAAIDAPITLSDNSTISSSNGGIFIGDDTNNYSFNIGTNSVGFAGAALVENHDAIVGSGNVVVDQSASNYPNDEFRQYTASPGLSGEVNVESGKLDLISDNNTTYPDIFSAASVLNVTNGATAYFDGDVNSTGSIAEPLSISGTGTTDCNSLYGGSIDCGAVESSVSSLNLSGNLALAADSQLNTDASTDSITISGPLSGAFKASNAIGTLVVQSSNNTSNTPNGTYSPTNSTASSSSSSTSPESSAAAVTTEKAPGTPDTGFGLTSSSAALPLIACAGAAVVIYAISRKFNKSYVKVKSSRR